MQEQFRDLKTWLMIGAVLVNAAAWLFGAGHRISAMEYRISAAETRLTKIESILDRLVEQQYDTAKNVYMLTVLMRQRMEIRDE